MEESPCRKQPMRTTGGAGDVSGAAPDPAAGEPAADEPQAVAVNQTYKSSGKLLGKSIVVTGGDSGIGQAAAAAFAKEGADVAIVFLNERSDAGETKQLVEQAGRKVPSDRLRLEERRGRQGGHRQGRGRVRQAGRAGQQHRGAVSANSLEDITAEQLATHTKPTSFPISSPPRRRSNT